MKKGMKEPFCYIKSENKRMIQQKKTCPPKKMSKGPKIITSY